MNYDVPYLIYILRSRVTYPCGKFPIPAGKFLPLRENSPTLQESFYSCGHTIRKVKFLSKKFNFDKTPTFSRVFRPKFFWQFFSWNQSCQQLKSPKPQHFHEFFTQKNRQISREIKKWSYFGYFYQRAIFLKESLLYFFAPDIFILQKGVVVFFLLLPTTFLENRS